MSDYKLSAVLELKDGLSVKVKKAKKNLSEVKSAAADASGAIEKTEGAFSKAGSAASEMAGKARMAKVALGGVRGTYSPIIRLKDEATSRIEGIKSKLNSIKGKTYTAMVNVKQNLGGAFGALGKLGGTASGVFNGMLMNTGMQMAGAAGIGLGIYDTINTYKDFSAQMSAVGAISGATSEEMEKLTDKAMEMGAKTQFSASESGKAFEYMAMAGWKTEEMMGGIEGIMNLAAASGEDLGRVSDIVTDALTAFGLKAKDAGHFSDVLAQASSNSNTSVGLMGMTFQYVAPIAGALKYSIEDVALAVGMMANAGIKGEKAGTALRSTLSRLVKPTDETFMALQNLGLNADEFMKNEDGSMKPFRQTMKELRGAFSGLTDAEKAQYAASIAGQEAMSGFLAIINASDEDFEKLAKQIDNSKDAAKRMSETRMDNLAGDLKILGSTWESVQLTLMKGEGANFLRDFVQKGTSYLEKFNKSLKDGFQVTDILNVVKDVVGDLTGKFLKLDGVGSILAGGTLAFGLSKIVGLVSSVGGGLKGIFDKASGFKGIGNVLVGAESVLGDADISKMNVKAGTVIVNGQVGAGGGLPGGGMPGGKAPAGGMSYAKMLGYGALALDLAHTAYSAYSKMQENSTRNEEVDWYEHMVNNDREYLRAHRDDFSEEEYAQHIEDFDRREETLEQYKKDVEAQNQAASDRAIADAIGASAGVVATFFGGPFAGILANELTKAVVNSKLDEAQDREQLAKDNGISITGNGTEASPIVIETEDLLENGGDIFDIDEMYAKDITDYLDFGTEAAREAYAERERSHAQALEKIAADEASAQAELKTSWLNMPLFAQSSMYDPIASGAEQCGQDIKQGFDSESEEIKGAWSGLASWFSDNVFGPIGAGISQLSSGASSLISEASSRYFGGRVDHNASGTSFFSGGLTEINEHGGEIIDLPTGSRIYPYATTLDMLQHEMQQMGEFNPSMLSFDVPNVSIESASQQSGSPQITITGNTFQVREEADIDKIAYKIQQLITEAQDNHNYVA
ncbi:MAG: phage tail tape measure protein [Schwartzia sp.]|nr:phage tail tape measure protein [Schwartzia sp. (in: firmicutes)]